MGSTYTNVVKIELICPDECVKEIKEAILKNALTGHKGDGIIAVSPVEEAINIRTGESKH